MTREEMRQILRERRKALRLSQTHVATKLGCSKNYVCMIERGHRFSLRTLMRWAAALRLNVEVREL